MNLLIWAIAAHGEGISGSDRIFIELSRRWQKKSKIDIFLWEEGKKMVGRQGLNESDDLRFEVLDLGRLCKKGFVICYFARILSAIKRAMSLKIDDPQNTCFYNASEFWMDSLPCVILKIRYPKAKWVATWYQTAPNPLTGYSEQGKREKKYFISALVYWLMQLPIKPLVKRYANKVIVNNEDEKRRFPKHTDRGNTIVLIGAVPLKEIDNWKLKIGNLPKVYDAVFQGRFHAQKGVVELVDIWKKVVDKIPNAKLAMIGDGPLMKSVKLKIKSEKLGKNIKLFGFVFDGPKKYKIFSQSKVVVHPAYYDSGGMATAEAMAFGLPAVGFNLRAYKSYYPKGMIKVKDENEFGKVIAKLINNAKLRKQVGSGGKKLIYNNYAWEKRAGQIYKQILEG